MSTASLVKPALLAGQLMCGKSGLDLRPGIERLLGKAGRRPRTSVSLGTRRPETPAWSGLHFGEQTEGGKTRLGEGRLPAGAVERALREAGAVVGQGILEERPISSGGMAPAREQPGRKGRPRAFGREVQVLRGGQGAKRPSPGARRAQPCRQRHSLSQQIPCPVGDTIRQRRARRLDKREERSRRGILILFADPSAILGHEVQEPARVCLPGMIDEGGVDRRKPHWPWIERIESGPPGAEPERPRCIIEAVAMTAVGHAMAGVLPNAAIVGKTAKMVERNHSRRRA